MFRHAFDIDFALAPEASCRALLLASSPHIAGVHGVILPNS